MLIARGALQAALAVLHDGGCESCAVLRNRGESRDQQMAARARVTKALAIALAAAKKLDVIVSNHLASDSAVRQVWKRNRRVENPYRRKAVASPPADETKEPEVPSLAPTPASPSAVASAKTDTAA